MICVTHSFVLLIKLIQIKAEHQAATCQARFFISVFHLIWAVYENSHGLDRNVHIWISQLGLCLFVASG